MWTWLMVDPFDGPEIATLVAALLSCVGMVAVAWIAHGAKTNARSAKEQVQNDHEVNLRDDIDGIKALLGSTASRVVDIDRGQLYIINEVGLLKAGWQTNRTDIDELMNTQDQRQKRSEWAEPLPDSRRARRYGNV